MAAIGIDRADLEEIFSAGIGMGEGLTDEATGRIGRAVAKVIDENNARIAMDLGSSGVKVKRSR
jgi:hypothetical protein